MWTVVIALGIQRGRRQWHMLTTKVWMLPQLPVPKPENRGNFFQRLETASSGVQPTWPLSPGALQAADMRILYSDSDVLSPSNFYQYQFTNINNNLFPSGLLFPGKRCTVCGSQRASLQASILLLAALKLLTVIKNDLDVISYLSKQRIC